MKMIVNYQFRLDFTPKKKKKLLTFENLNI